MNAMTLLRAMSAIDPQDIAAAYAAADGSRHADIVLTRTSENSQTAVMPAPLQKTASAGKRYVIGGWAAAAACIALIAAAGLYFRQRDDMLTVQSGSGAVAEVTGTTVTQSAETAPAESTQTTPDSGVTAGGFIESEPQQTTLPGEDEPVQQNPESTAPQPADPDTAENSGTESSLPQEQPTEIPALVAMADGSGTLTHPDGSPYAQGESAYEAMENAAEIRAYLDRQDPLVTLGTGKKSDSVCDAIFADPVLLHISWQMPDDRWTSYGIQKAELTSDGILHLTIGMYAEEAAHAEPWIYETALLCEAGSVPAVTGAEISLQYYQDKDETGIQNYILYHNSLREDVYIRTAGA